MEPILEGASPIREAIESKSRELGVQITFDIENKTAEEKENIYRETLKFLESLNDEEKTKLAEVAGEMMAINIEGIEDLEYLTVKVRPGAEETMPTPVPAPAPTPASTSEIEVKPKEQNGNGKTDSHIALDAMKIVNEYMGGGVNEARTPNFTALNIDQKNSVYNLVIGLPKLLSYNPKASDWLRGKLFLAGEPGVSYENGQLKIGPGATANGVVNFIKGQISNPSPDIAPTPTPTPTPPILEPITVESEVVLGDTKEPEKEPVYDVPLMQASAGDMVMGEPGWGGPLKIMSKSIDPSNPHFYLGDDSEPRKFLIRGEDINRYRATRKKQTSVEGSQPAPPTPEPVPIPSGTESQEDNPVDVLKKMGFEVDFPARRNRTTHTYEEIEGDPNWAKNVVEALKILGVSSSDQIEINRIIVGSDTIFYSSSNFNSQKRLFVSADLDPQELANFIKFAVDKFKETNSTVGFYMYEDQKKLNQENSEPALTPEPTQPFVPVVQEKINKQPSNWAELNNLLGDLGIELELNEEHLAKFEGKNTAEEKYKEIKEAIASFPNKNVLKEKFNTIRLVYPEFLKNNPKISIRDNILYMDLGISKQEITDFLNNTFGSDVAPAPTPTPTPTPEPVPTTPEPIAVTPEKSLDEEWLEFVKLRDDLAKTEALKRNYSGDTGISVEDLKAKYISDKEKIASLTRRNAYVRFGFGEGPLTREQETSLNDYLFEELVKKENDVYLNALKEARGERLVDKVWEGAKSLLSTKAVKWYLGLSRKERIACSFVLGTAAGLTFGAGVGAFGVVGYVGKRVLTGSAGIGMGELVNKKKSWSAEEIKRKEDEETEALKNSNFSLEEKSKQLTEIQKKYKKERLKAAAWKVGLTATAGAGTGLLANLAEGAFAGNQEEKVLSL
ncbi:MAG: hypothetical protein UT00_C0006G0021 [Parcubacteria group bacterium GW2011_GWA1_38_7]|nr:MAG: hypothetical protein UT00_C0006G0021 [Parcubacteria group bacterium GW2011_GWA1_38_7]